MYIDILTPTGGPQRAGKAVWHGIAAPFLGSETVKVLTHYRIPVMVRR